VLDRIVDEACLLLGARRVAIAVLEAGAEPMPIIRFRAARGLSPAFAQRLRPLSWRDGTTPIAIRERRPVWTADILTDRALELTPPTRAIIEAEGYRAVLSVPLLAGERALGGGGAGERRPLPPRLRARREAHDAERADPPHHRCCLQP
jgi:GAF domain-containing protein